MTPRRTGRAGGFARYRSYSTWSELPGPRDSPWDRSKRRPIWESFDPVRRIRTRPRDCPSDATQLVESGVVERHAVAPEGAAGLEEAVPQRSRQLGEGAPPRGSDLLEVLRGQ